MSWLTELACKVAQHVKAAADVPYGAGDAISNAAVASNLIPRVARAAPLWSVLGEGLLQDLPQQISDPAAFEQGLWDDWSGKPGASLTESTKPWWDSGLTAGQRMTRVGRTLGAGLGSPVRYLESTVAGPFQLAYMAGQRYKQRQSIAKQEQQLAQAQKGRRLVTPGELSGMAKAKPGSMYFDENEGLWAPTQQHFQQMPAEEQSRISRAFGSQWKPRGQPQPQIAKAPATSDWSWHVPYSMPSSSTPPRVPGPPAQPQGASLSRTQGLNASPGGLVGGR
jgi:hypothetical protein